MDEWTGMSMQILKGQSEEKHYHSDVELLFVIDGQIEVYAEEKTIEMYREDILVINSSCAHELRCTEETIFCQVFFSMQVLSGLLGEQCILFECNSAMDQVRSYGEIRSCLRELVHNYVRSSHKTKCLEKSKLFHILDYLIENYSRETSGDLLRESEDVRLQEIFQYVNVNYQNNLSLSELAENMYVSTSTLSRFFKKKTGYYFAEYVTSVRLKHALNDLVFTDKNITRIALDAGFSNASVLNKVFKNAYGVTPSDYKNQSKQSADMIAKEQEEMRRMLLDKLDNPSLSGKIIPHFETIKLMVDVSKEENYSKFWNKAMNLGAAFNLIQAKIQNHVIQLHKMLNFKYARLWSVFSGRLMICDGSENHYYNYDMLDSVLDFLVSQGITPFLDLGKRPDTAVGKMNLAIYYAKEYIDFTSRKAWEDFLEDFLDHIVDRYGKKQVNQWIFELSCDRTHYEESCYYKDENYDFAEVFSHAYRAIKSRIPGAKVCGPGAIADLDRTFTVNLLKKLKAKDCVPDMATFLMFPYVPVVYGDEVRYKQAGTEHFELEELRKIRNSLEEAGIPDCPICISEWNCTLMNRNYINDSCFRAAMSVKVMGELMGQMDMLIPWVASDWMSRYYDSMRIANGGAGFLTKDGIRKPVSYAWQFMRMMGKKLLDHGENFIITKKGESDYYILCCNFKWYSAKYLIKEENTVIPDDIKGIYVDENVLKGDILLTGLRNGDYLIKIRRVYPGANTLLSVWERFEYDRHVAPSEIDYIRDCCKPELTMKKHKVSDGQMQVTFEMEAHEVTLLHIYKC